MVKLNNGNSWKKEILPVAIPSKHPLHFLPRLAIPLMLGIDVDRQVRELHHPRGLLAVHGTHHRHRQLLRSGGELGAFFGHGHSRVVHDRGHNHQSFGICLIGGIAENGDPEDNFTPEQWLVLEMLIEVCRFAIRRPEWLAITISRLTKPARTSLLNSRFR